MVRIRVALLLLLSFAAGSALAAPSIESEDAVARDIVAVDTLRFLEPGVDLATRREIFADLERQLVDAPTPVNLYVLGSLYRRGDQAKTPAFEKNADKAREYLSRAALAGHLSAMAKLSVLELEAQNRFEANVWAQLYFHYFNETPRTGRRQSDSFAASIVAAAQNGFPKSEHAALNDSVGMMISQYDAKIRAGREAMEIASNSGPVEEARPGTRLLHPTQGRPPSGVAEFYVAFDADGSVRKVWLLDAWPDDRIARTLRPIAMGYSVKTKPGIAAEDVIALLPIEYGDQRHRVRKQD